MAVVHASKSLARHIVARRSKQPTIPFLTETLEPRTLLSTYDAAADFSPTANPNGAWSYGVTQSLGSAFSLYTYSYTSGAGEARWSAPDTSQSPPWVAENLTGSSITDGTHVAPVGVLDMHPGPDGQYTDARLTLPSGGPLKVTFTFGGLDTVGTTTDVHVLLDGKSLADGNINGYGDTFSDTVTATAKAGDTLDFVVGYGNGSYLYDSTSLTAQITAGGDLSVIAQPSNTAVKDTIDPVKVAVLDSTGSIDTSATTAITVAIAPTSTGKGKLTGSTTQNAVAGVATFSNLSIDDAGQYSLNFTDAGGDTTASGLFDITDGKLVFSVAPHNGNIDEPLNPVVVVELKDSKGKIITSDSSSVVTLTPISLVAGSDIRRGNVETLVDGVARFPDLTFAQADFYKLTASDDSGDTECTSNRFRIAGDHLKFTEQPANRQLNSIFNVGVQILDSHNKPDPYTDSFIQLSLNTIKGGASAVLAGTTLQAFSGGSVSFGDEEALSINVAGTYTLTATEMDMALGVLGPTYLTTPITTNKFVVGNDHVIFKTEFSDIGVDRVITFKAQLLDAQDKLVKTEDGNLISVEAQRIGATGGQIDGDLTAEISGGTASFGTDNGIAIKNAGTYYFTGMETDSTGIPIVGSESGSSNQFQVYDNHIVILKQPEAEVAASAPISVTLAVEDFKDRVLLTNAGSVQIVLNTIAGGAGAVVNFSTAPLNADGEYVLAGKSALSISVVGTYSLTFNVSDPTTGTTSESVLPKTSIEFKVVGNHLQFIDQPQDVGVDEPNTFKVGLFDLHDKLVTTDNSDAVSLSVSPQYAVTTPDFTATGPSQLTFHNGVADFSDSNGVSINQAATYAINADEIGSDGSVLSDELISSDNFKVMPNHLVFTREPETTDVAKVVPFTVALENFKNKVVTNESSTGVSITVQTLSGAEEATPSGGSLLLEEGQVSFAGESGIYFNAPGKFTFTATEVDASGAEVDGSIPATSDEFEIRPDKLVFINQPTNARVNQPITFGIAIASGSGTNSIIPAESANAGISVTLDTPAGNSAKVTGETTLYYSSSGNGTSLLTFTVSIDTPGTYTFTATEVADVMDVEGTTKSRVFVVK